MSHLLVVDDEPRVVTMLRRLLSQEGHSVTGAGDGVLALQQLASDEFDLVLLDLRMPQCSGHKVLATMRERGDNTPVLVLSAVNDVATRVQSLDLGAVDFVAKPFHTSELLARVRRHLTVTPVREVDQSRHLVGGGIRLDLERRRATVDGVAVVQALGTPADRDGAGRGLLLLRSLRWARAPDCSGSGSRSPPGAPS